MFEDFFKFLMKKEFLISIAIVIAAVVIYFFTKRIIQRIMNRNIPNTKIDRKRKTYIKLFPI